MTFIGKMLAIFNLILGLGIVSWATSVYAHRPGWFEPKVEGGPDRGTDPKSFAELKSEANTLYRAANLASGTWGVNLKALEVLEQRRDLRRKEYAQRLEWTKTGNKDKDNNAFFAPIYEKDSAGNATSMLQLYTLDDVGNYTQILGDAVIGPDKKPLKGSETLLTNFSGDVKAVEELAEKSVKHREEYAKISAQILLDEERLLKMIVIRDSVQGELFYLSSFEVNVYETRETVLRRQKQLVLRLMELGGVGLKPAKAPVKQ
ncbi:MAG: hypothetical protein U0792_04725 [Gemmataceae bacterium]